MNACAYVVSGPPRFAASRPSLEASEVRQTGINTRTDTQTVAQPCHPSNLRGAHLLSVRIVALRACVRVRRVCRVCVLYNDGMPLACTRLLNALSTDTRAPKHNATARTLAACRVTKPAANSASTRSGRISCSGFGIWHRTSACRVWRVAPAQERRNVRVA